MITSRTIAVNPASNTQPPLTKGSQWLRNIHPAPSLLDMNEYTSECLGTSQKKRKSFVSPYTLFRLVGAVMLICGGAIQINGGDILFGAPAWIDASAWILVVLAAMLFVGLGGRVVPLALTSGFVLALIQHASFTGGIITSNMSLIIAGAVFSAVFVIGGTGQRTLDRFIKKVILWKVFS